MTEALIDRITLADLRAIRPYDFVIFVLRAGNANGTGLTFEGDESGGFVDEINKEAAESQMWLPFFTRSFRYLSSERLILFVTSVGTRTPYWRLCNELKNDQLNELFGAVADGRIPVIAGQPMGAGDFREWISTGLLGSYAKREDAVEYIDMMTNFIRGEASFIRDRGLVNAFKHLKSVRSNASVKLSSENDRGEFEPILALTEGLQWIESTLNKKGELAVSVVTDDPDSKADRCALINASIALRNALAVQIGLLERTRSVNLVLSGLEPVVSAAQKTRFNFVFDIQQGAQA